MLSNSTGRLVVLAFSNALLAALASADVRVVGAGQAYATVQLAVNAATSGDTVLVKAGTHAGFTIDGKGLTVVGDSTTRPTISGGVIVRNLPASRTVVLAHLLLRGGVNANLNEGALRLADDQVGLPDGSGGSVWIERCHGGVAITRSTLYGARGYSDDFTAGSGYPALMLEGAIAAVHDSTLRGGKGGSSLDLGGTGGDGARLRSSATPGFPTYLHASGSTFTGGAGGDTYENVFDYWAYVGFGGNGLATDGGTSAWRIGCSYVPGPAGQWFYCYPASYGGPGLSEVVNGTATSFAPLPLALSAPTLAREGTTIALAIDGAPGDFVYLQSSLRPAFAAQASLRGVRLTQADGPWFLPQHSLATGSARPIVRLGPTGHAVVSFALPALDAGESARSGFVQLTRFAADGSATVGAFSPLTIVDASY